VTEEDYRAFYASAFARLVGQVYLLTGDFAEAQDAVQEAFIRAWSRRHRFADGDEPDAWIRTVARRVAVSRWRSSRSGLAAWRRRGPMLRTRTAEAVHIDVSQVVVTAESAAGKPKPTKS
jgi:RNA polymerase sigma-70 factor (ECF subfamily)